MMPTEELSSSTWCIKGKAKSPTIYLVSRQAAVHETVKSLKWKRAKRAGSSLPSFDIGWIESADLNFYRQIRPYQRVNQAPGMEELSRKKNLCRNLKAMRAAYPDCYDIFPKSWLIPEEYPSLINYMKANPSSVVIVKPDGRCQGRGIYLTGKYEDIDPRNNQVCQLYIERPFLINGFKFDLRLYALITSFDPLRVFLYDDGLVRLCTQPYKAPCSGNFSSSFMHLTNYAINKNSSSYCFNKDGCANDKDSKWTVKAFFEWLASTDCRLNITSIWSDIQHVIAKAIISGSASLRHQYRVHFPMLNNGAISFQLLGVDILLDETLRPWLLEINRNPSLKCDTSLDHMVKGAMLRDLFTIVVPETRSSASASFRNRLLSFAADSDDRAAIVSQQIHLEQRRSLETGFKLILPIDSKEGLQPCPYSCFISGNQTIFEARTKQKTRRRTVSII